MSDYTGPGRDPIDPEDVLIEDELPFPWPPAEDETPVQAFARTWQESALSPARFFRSMPEDYPVLPALLYAIIIGIVVNAVQLFWYYVLPTAAASSEMSMRDGLHHPMQLLLGWGAVSLSSFFMTPVGAVMGTVIGAAFIQIFSRLFIRDCVRFKRTLCVVCFASSSAAFGVVPVIGVVFSAVGGIIITVIGIREVNRTTTARATTTVLAPYGCMVIVGLLFVMTAGLLVGPALLDALKGSR
jgi:hypothetical protein